MTKIPADAYDDMFSRLGHALYEYDGLTEALYAYQQQKIETAAPAVERPPVFETGVVVTSDQRQWGAIDRSTGFRALHAPVANMR